jgi:cytochrome c oxidase subunit II
MRSIPALMLAVLLGVLWVKGGAAATPADEMIVRVTARKFEYSPNEIVVKKGVVVVLEFASEDRHHGFSLPAFGVRADIEPGVVNRVRLRPDRAGRFPFHCDVFCGAGHEDMTGTLVVTD